MKKLKVLFLAIISLCTFAFSACGEKCDHQVETWSVRTPATCLEAGEEYGPCTLCGKEQTRAIPELGHDMGDVAAQEPDCVNAGWDAHQACQREGCNYSTKVEIPELGHDMVPVAAKTPDCDDVGWAEHEECQREGCNYSTKVEIQANGHTFTDGVHCDNCIELNATKELVINEFISWAEVIRAEETFDGDTLIIPAYYNGKPVTTIVEDAFKRNMNLKTVILPDTITMIEEDAFVHCDNLETLIIGNGDMTIGKRAFQQCYNLMYLELGTGKKTFESNAFNYNTRMINIYNKSSTVLTQKSYTNGYVAKWARKISTTGTDLLPITKDDDGFIYYTENSEKHLFNYVGVDTEITIPSGIVYIEEECFSNNSTVTSITLPSSVKVIGPAAFNWCNALKTLNLNEGLERIYYNFISQTYQLKSLVIPASVIWFDHGAMWSNHLETLEFADTTGWKYQVQAIDYHHGAINAADMQDPAQNVLNFDDIDVWRDYLLYKGTYNEDYVM